MVTPPPSPRSRSDYRPDIDGLRALAVILVMLFHAGLGPFSGGFIGVDVFFVISGFLITRIIIDEIAVTGRFSFSGFYVRRARRILPALFATIGLTAIVAFLLFSPPDLERFGASMLSALVGVSNIFFWQESGYFDVDAITKPLLHTWSLGVEEQFYLIWPLLLLALTRQSWRITLFGIVAIGLASLWLNGWFLSGYAIPQIVALLPSTESWLREAPAAVFFLTPFRAFEFAIGALMVWLVRLQPRHTLILEPTLLIGLGMIVYAAVSFTDETAFPYLNALVPCIGTAFVIYAGKSPAVGWLLRNQAAVAIGLISYSLYLLHWPIIVFWTYYKFAPLTAGEKYVVCVAAIAGAALMYRFVERPFRLRGRDGIKRWRPRQVAAVSVATVLVLSVPAVAFWQGSGLAWRVPAERLTISNQEWRRLEKSKYCQNWVKSKPRDLFTCQNDQGASRDIIVWGDSHAQHLVAGFSEVYPRHNVHVLYMIGCIPQSGFEGFVRHAKDEQWARDCIDRNRRALDYLTTSQPPAYIILSSAKRNTPDGVTPATLHILKELKKVGHEAFVLGDFIRPGKDIRNCIETPDWLVPDSMLKRRCGASQESMRPQIKYNHAMVRLIPDFIDVTDVQCSNDVCKFTEGGTLLFRDSHHLTTTGAAYFIGKLKPRLPIPE